MAPIGLLRAIRMSGVGYQNRETARIGHFVDFRVEVVDDEVGCRNLRLEFRECGRLIQSQYEM